MPDHEGITEERLAQRQGELERQERAIREQLRSTQQSRQPSELDGNHNPQIGQGRERQRDQPGERRPQETREERAANIIDRFLNEEHEVEPQDTSHAAALAIETFIINRKIAEINAKLDMRILTLYDDISNQELQEEKDFLNINKQYIKNKIKKKVKDTWNTMSPSDRNWLLAIETEAQSLDREQFLTTFIDKYTNIEEAKREIEQDNQGTLSLAQQWLYLEGRMKRWKDRIDRSEL
jgi:hypothetical protein